MCRDGVVQGQVSRVSSYHHGQHGKDLGDRTDAVDGVWIDLIVGGRGGGSEVPQPVSLAPNQFLVVDNTEGYGRRGCGEESRVHRWDALSGDKVHHVGGGEESCGDGGWEVVFGERFVADGGWGGTPSEGGGESGMDQGDVEEEEEE